jgi:hypothetical protein
MSALGAEATDDEFYLMYDALTKRASGGLGDAVPVHVLDCAAGVADEVVMALAGDVEASGAAFDGNLADEAGLYEVTEIVVSGGAGRARVEAVDALKDFRSGGMSMMLKQERHHAEALWRTA